MARSQGRRANPMILVGLGWVSSRALMLMVLAAVVLNGRPLRDALRGWDAAIYTRISQQGYRDPQEVAFFWGLPMLLRGLSRLGLDPALAGMAVALVCSALATLALMRIASTGFGHRRRHQPLTGSLAAVLWLVAPTTVFTTVAYTEAPFCAAAFWAWERAMNRRWGQAAVLAGLACTLRVSGLFLVAALVVMALFGNGTAETKPRLWSSRIIDAVWMLIPTVVLLGYIFWLWQDTGSWRAWYDAQQAGWNRGFTRPLDALVNTWHASDPARWPDRPLVGRVFFIEMISMALGLLTTIICLLRRRWAEATWVGLQVIALGTTYWYMSINRALLLWFPFFVMVSALLTHPYQGGRRSLRGPATLVTGALLLVSVVGAVFWAWLFYTGQWAS